MEILRLKVKPAANKKQVLLFTNSGIYSQTLVSKDTKPSSQQKPKK